MTADRPTPRNGENVTDEQITEHQVRRKMVSCHLESVADQLFEASRCRRDDVDVEDLVRWARYELAIAEEILGDHCDEAAA